MNEPGARDAPERHIQKAMSNRFLSYFISVRATVIGRSLQKPPRGPRRVPAFLPRRMPQFQPIDFLAERLFKATENLARALASCQAFLARRRDEEAARKGRFERFAAPGHNKMLNRAPILVIFFLRDAR
jgi:hypothetical protein